MMTEFYDYYKEFLNGSVKVGNRNNMLFRAALVALASERSMEPLIEKAIELGLSKSEVNATIASAKRIDLSRVNKYRLYYTPIKSENYINEFGKQFTDKDMNRFFRDMITGLYKPDDYVCLASLNKDTREFAYRIYKYSDLFSNEFTIPKNGLIKINPVDGKGISNSNVVDYRYVLIENDKMPLSRQYEILMNSGLPIKFIIYSGNKSLHTIVKVFANSPEEYIDRSNAIFSHMLKLGYECDKAAMHYGSYTRLAGSYRGAIPQYIVEEDVGTETFEEFIRTKKDTDVPSIVSFKSIKETIQKSRKPLIEGILDEGNCMILAGEPKVGKTYLLLQLACALSSGKHWLGRPVQKKNVLYVNVEVDDSVILSRVDAISRYMEIDENNIFMINMRGSTVRYSDFFEYILSDKCKDMMSRIDVLIVDPIYKLFMGDENSQREVTAFFRYVDKSLLSIGKTFIFSHHHNKGIGNTLSRISGTSVFSRFPDSILMVRRIDNNMIEISYDLRNMESPEPETFVFSPPLHCPVVINNKDKE